MISQSDVADPPNEAVTEKFECAQGLTGANRAESRTLLSLQAAVESYWHVFASSLHPSSWADELSPLLPIVTHVPCFKSDLLLRARAPSLGRFTTR